jgi:DNA-binding response OmpR family regulator
LKYRITIVEDDPDILFTLQMMLANAGYEIEALSTGRSIMDGSFNCPDLFILDKRMPDMDGLVICKHLRASAATSAVPIIVISASPKFGPQAIRAGANDFLEKPFQLKSLLLMVDKYLNGNEK